jgi:hypothetical protein
MNHLPRVIDMRAPLRAIWPPLILLFLASSMMIAAAFAGWPLLGVVVLPSVPILSLDARARSLDYRYARSHLQRGRSPERIAAIFRMSWCMRVACQAAANAAGPEIGKRVEQFYRAEGYRRFHVTPDGTFTRHTPFLNLLFWRITLLGYDEGRRRTFTAIIFPAFATDASGSAGSRRHAA